MRTSQMDVFGPGFVPGKVSVARDAVVRAMKREYAVAPDVPKTPSPTADQSDDLASQAPQSIDVA